MKVNKRALLVDIGGAKQPHDTNPKYHWEILDVSGTHKYPSYNLNSGEPFPIDSHTVTAYYCSMTLEHVHPFKIPFVLSEMNRTLVRNGMVRIVVPDIREGIRLYLDAPEKLREKKYPYMTAGYPLTACGYLFAWIKSEMKEEKAHGRTGHQMMFDFETMLYYLKIARFIGFKRRAYNECEEYFVGKDSVRYADWALYVEAKKE